MKIIASDLDGTAIRPVESVFGDKKTITTSEARLLFEPEAVRFFYEKSIRSSMKVGDYFVFCTRQYENVARVIVDAMFPDQNIPLFARWPENENPHGKQHLIYDICDFYRCTPRDITLLDDNFSTIYQAYILGCRVRHAYYNNRSLMWAVDSNTQNIYTPYNFGPPWL